MTRDTLFEYLTFGLKVKNYYDVTPIFEPRECATSKVGVFESMFLVQSEFFEKLKNRLYSRSNILITDDYVELFGENNIVDTSNFVKVVDQYYSVFEGSVVNAVGVFQEIVELYESEISSLAEEVTHGRLVISSEDVIEELTKINSTLQAVTEELSGLPLSDVVTHVDSGIKSFRNEMLDELEKRLTASQDGIGRQVGDIKTLNANMASRLTAVLKSCSAAEDATVQAGLAISEVNEAMSNLASQMSLVITAVSGTSKPECRFNLELLKSVEDQLVALRETINELIKANTDVSNDILSVKKTVVASTAVGTTAMLIGEVATK